MPCAHVWKYRRRGPSTVSRRPSPAPYCPPLNIQHNPSLSLGHCLIKAFQTPELTVCVRRRAGAVTFALIQAMEQGQAATYQALLRAMRYSLKNGPQHFPAAPQLAASRTFDLNRPFCL